MKTKTPKAGESKFNPKNPKQHCWKHAAAVVRWCRGLTPKMSQSWLPGFEPAEHHLD